MYRKENIYFSQSMDYYASKQFGVNKLKNNKKKNIDKNVSRSKYNYGKCDKSRNVRKIADRASHHRIRNIIRNAESKGILDLETMPGSTSNLKRCNKKSRDASRSWLTNLKTNSVGNKKQGRALTFTETHPKLRDKYGNIVPDLHSYWSYARNRFNIKTLQWSVTEYKQEPIKDEKEFCTIGTRPVVCYNAK